DGGVSARGGLHRSHPQGREAPRFAGEKSNQVGVNVQLETGEGLGLGNTGPLVAPCGGGVGLGAAGFIPFSAAPRGACPSPRRTQDRTVPLIGFLNSASPGPFARLVDAFRQGLREGGYVEGRNVRIEYRWAEGQFARLPELATDLVHRRVSLIVAAGGTVSARAAKEASATIPVLFIVGPNPIGDGLVTSLNRPGGNATGVALYTSDLLPKRLELLEKLLPRAAKIAVLVNPSDAAHELETKYVEDAMRVTGQQMVLLKVSA